MSTEITSVATWHVLGQTVIGQTHIRKGLPNQDALWKSADDVGLPLVLAIADGHGSEQYFRSQQGAAFAVEIARETLLQFAQGFSGTEVNLSLLAPLADQLPSSIVQQWHDRVTQHLHTHRFFDDDEWQRFDQGNKLPKMPRDGLLSYGATFLAVLITHSFLLCLQLGDGDIVFVMDDGRTVKPMGDDPRLLANETTSLCSPMATNDFRVHYQSLQNQLPVLILLSTDGYANSFNTQKDFLQVGPDILRLLQKEGVEKVSHEIKGWLQAATTRGSGDDITLGMLYHEIPGAQLLADTIATRQAVQVDVPVQTGTVETQHIPAAQPLTDTDADTLLKQPQQPAPGQESVAKTNANLPRAQALPEAKPIVDADAPTVIKQPLSEQGPATESDAGAVPEEGKAGGDVGAENTTQPATLVVSHTVNGNNIFSSIRDALANAQSGMRIEVDAGIYHEQLIIDQDIELVGRDMDSNEVVLEGSANCLLIRADHAQVSNLTIRGKRSAFDISFKPQALVEVTGRNAVLSHCDISGARIGVRVHGAIAHPTIQDCTIHDHTNYGLVFEQGAFGLVVDSSILANKFTNIKITSGACPTIRHCEIAQAGRDGISMSKNARGRIIGCTVADNHVTGIVVNQQSNPIIHDCIVSANGTHGVWFKQKTQGMLSGSRIIGNTQHGVFVEGAYLHIQSCSVEQQKGNGVLISGQNSGGLIEDCEISQSVLAGILIRKDANLFIRSCAISDGQNNGVQIEERGQAVIEQCKLTGNALYAILVQGIKSSIMLHETHIVSNESNATSAIRLLANSSGVLERCRIVSRRASGIEARDGASVYVRLCIVEATRHAVDISNKSIAELTGGNFKSATPADAAIKQDSSSVLHFEKHAQI